MTLTAANPGGWALNEVLTSAQVNHLQNELLKAIDGVNGGTYALQSQLAFDGPADLVILGTLEIASGGLLSVPVGGDISVFGELTINAAGDLLVDGVIAIRAPGTLEVRSGGELDVLSGGDLNVRAGGGITVDSGGQVSFDGGGILNLNASSVVSADAGSTQQLNGTTNVQSGGLVRVLSGGTLRVDEVEDLIIDDDNVAFRSTLTPAFVTHNGGIPDFIGTANAHWLQHQVGLSTALGFALAILPGDSLGSVNVQIQGGAGGGHGGLLPVKPTVEIIEVTTGGVTVIASVLDPSASAAAYDAAHLVSVSGGSLPYLATGNPLYVRITGESGPNAVADTTSFNFITGTLTARAVRAANEIY